MEYLSEIAPLVSVILTSALGFFVWYRDKKQQDAEVDHTRTETAIDIIEMLERRVGLLENLVTRNESELREEVEKRQSIQNLMNEQGATIISQGAKLRRYEEIQESQAATILSLKDSTAKLQARVNYLEEENTRLLIENRKLQSKNV
jgi:hypothetical protein